MNLYFTGFQTLPMVSSMETLHNIPKAVKPLRSFCLIKGLTNFNPALEAEHKGSSASNTKTDVLPDLCPNA